MKRIKATVNFICFILVVLLLFIKLTWLFRNNNEEARTNIVGFKNESNVDVVLIGGSNILRYYQPMDAWREYGITSYNYGTSAASLDLLKNYCEESRKTNEAKLYVFELRPIVFDYVVDESSIRNWTDSVNPFSINRIKGIGDYFSVREQSEYDMPSFYLDLAKYHSETDVLASEDHWNMPKASAFFSVSKGFKASDDHHFFSKPEYRSAETELNEKQKKTLDHLLSYCDKEGLNVLFTVCPYIVEDDDWGVLNSTEGYIESRGYDFVNFNLLYDEIGLDFDTDFADVSHLNYLGSEKYTSYLARYIVENYEIEDHRGDKLFAVWEECEKDYSAIEKKWQISINKIIKSHMDSVEMESEIRKIDDFSDWYNVVRSQGDNYIIFVENTGGVLALTNNYEYAGFVDDFEIEDNDVSFFSVKNGNKFLVKPQKNDEIYSGEIVRDGGNYSADYIIKSGKDARIEINGEDYILNETGLNIVVYNKNDGRIVDAIVVQTDGNYAGDMRKKF